MYLEKYFQERFSQKGLKGQLKTFFFAKGQGNTIKDLQGKLKCQAFPEILTLHFLNLPDILGSAQLSAILGTAYILQKVSLSCWIDAEKWLRIAKKRTGKDHTIIINIYGLLENPNIYLISYAKLITYQETIMTNMQNIMKYSTKRNYKYVPFQEAFPWLQ